MKTLEDQWKTYRDACYPTGVSKLQEVECRQSFFAGALVVLKLATDRAADLSEEDAFKSVGDLIREAQTVCKQRMYEMKGRN
jgi:hypothetical protein